MKLTALILIVAMLHASAKTIAQKVTLHATNAPISSIFKQIKQQTGYDFAFTGDVLESAKPVTISVKNTELKDVLELIFRDEPLDYQVGDRAITVTAKKQVSAESSRPVLIQQFIDVTGTVIDENSQPLSQATVKTKDGKRITTTDVKGNFTIKGVDPSTTILISFIGFDSRELKVTENFGSITLKTASNPLDEVQVIAYGLTTERLSVGNVNSIDAKTIGEQPVSDPILTLEGRIPGVIIQQQNGLTTTAVKMQIQGLNSVNAGSDPLYIIDGVPYNGQMLPNNASNYGLSGQGNGSYLGGQANISPFSFLSPNDIESISVLKDASATSIYGSRAANGAVIITTKKGKAGRTEINLNVQQGFGKDAEMPKLLNTQQYLQLRHWALADDNLTPGTYDFDLNGVWDTTSNTNWQKLLLGGTAKFQDYNGSISGGSNNLNYIVSGTYHRETTVFPGAFSDNKGSFHFSLNGASINSRFKYQFSGSYLADKNILPVSDLTQLAMKTPPDAPSIYNADGSINWAPDPNGVSTFGAIAQALNQKYTNSIANLIGNGVLSYEISKDFMFKSNFGYNDRQQNELTTVPLSTIEPENRPYATNAAVYTNNHQSVWNVEPQINFNSLFFGGKLSVLVGGTIQQEKAIGSIIAGGNYPNDQLLSDIGSASALYIRSSSAYQYKYSAAFGRLNYNWQDKYLFEASARRDGSSRFGADNLFQTFGSVGIGWIFTEEKVVKKSMPFLSYGKFSSSYGTTGNDQIGNYNFLSTYSVSYTPIPYQSGNSLFPNGIANPDLQWELDKKLNVKLDLGFFNDRITTSMDYYQNRTSNLLLDYNLAITTGFAYSNLNLPAIIQNKGWEFSLSTVNIRSGNFNWRSELNLTVPVDNQKLLSFPGLASSSYASIWKIGQSIQTNRVYQYLGLDPKTGYYLFSDGNGGSTSTPDYTIAANALVSVNPKLYGGLTNTLNYKSFSLQFLLQFTKQNGLDAYIEQDPVGGALRNLPQAFLNSWHTSDVNAKYLKLTTGADFQAFLNALSAAGSTANIRDASYVKLKNLSISWTIPGVWLKNTGLNSIRLFMQGQNLLTFTHYLRGIDPETQSYTTLPPLRVISFGLNLNM